VSYAVVRGSPWLNAHTGRRCGSSCSGKPGWSVSAIARHLGCDRKTVRAYVRGERQAGVRAGTAPDPLAPFAAYLFARFTDDPQLWATALFDEVTPLGYRLSYASFARQLRRAGLRPHCEPCAGVSGRDTIEGSYDPGMAYDKRLAGQARDYLREAAGVGMNHG
jgi:hypothetical protein